MVGSGVTWDPARWAPAVGLSAAPAAERGQPAVADQALSAAEEWCLWGPALLGEAAWAWQQEHHLPSLQSCLVPPKGHAEPQECCGVPSAPSTLSATRGEERCMVAGFVCTLLSVCTGKLGRSTDFQ